MDLGSIFMGVLTLAFFIVPVIYLQKVQKKEKKGFLKDFMQLAQQQQVVVKEHDFWNHCYAIGLDPVSHKLFFLKKREGLEQKVVIDLKEVEKSTVINQSRVVNDNRIIDRLALSFTFRNPRMAEKTLEFYNNEESMSLTEEVQLLEKWKALTDSTLREIANRKTSVASQNNPGVLV